MDPDLFGKDYILLERCGEGSFAEVFHVRQRTTGTNYAIKRLKTRYKTLDEVSQINEISILRTLVSHPNIIKLENVLYDYSSGSVALVLEYVEFNLLHFMKKGFKYTSNYRVNNSNIESFALIVLYQLLKSASYFHSFFIFHRDIKPENIMINPETLEVKLTDFGSSRKAGIRIQYTEYVSTRWYRAPECILTSGSYGPPIDIWAIGCIFYEILSGRPLFPGENEIDQISKINQVIGSPTSDTLAQFSRNPTKNPAFQKFNFPQRNPLDLSILLQTTNQDVVDLIRNMLTYNPTDRISAQEAVLHPAFKEIRQFEDEWTNSDSFTNKLSLPLYIFKRITGESVDLNTKKAGAIDKPLENNVFLTKKISLQQKMSFIPETNKEQIKRKAENKIRMQPMKKKIENDENKSVVSQKRSIPLYPIHRSSKKMLDTSSMHSVKLNNKQPILPAIMHISYQKPVPKIISPQLLNNSLNLKLV